MKKRAKKDVPQVGNWFCGQCGEATSSFHTVDHCIRHLSQKIEDLDALLARHVMEEHPKCRKVRP